MRLAHRVARPYSNNNRAPDREAVHVLHVALLSSGAAALMPEEKRLATDNGSRAMQKRRPPSSAITGPADHAAPMLEIEAKPAERYYKLNELTQKPFICKTFRKPCHPIFPQFHRKRH